MPTHPGYVIPFVYPKSPMPEDVVNPSRYFIISGGYYYDSLACGSARHRRHSTRHELEASSLSGKPFVVCY